MFIKESILKTKKPFLAVLIAVFVLGAMPISAALACPSGGYCPPGQVIIACDRDGNPICAEDYNKKPTQRPEPPSELGMIAWECIETAQDAWNIACWIKFMAKEAGIIDED